MRLVAIIILLILSNCKGETKNDTENEIQNNIRSETEINTEHETGIDNSVNEMWENYVASNPEFREEELPDSGYFHNNENDANRLAQLIVSGKKQAGSNLYFWYEEANADLPKIGTKNIITDFDGTARAIIEIRKVDTSPFNKISQDYAKLDMGVDVEPLKKWKKAHWDFFASALEQSGQKPTEEMLIVCEWFETIWPEKKV